MDWGSTWDFLWHFLIIFAWIAYLLVLFQILTDGLTLRSLTVEEDDLGFRDYIRAVGRDAPREAGKPAETGKPKTTKQTTSA